MESKDTEALIVYPRVTVSFTQSSYSDVWDCQ